MKIANLLVSYSTGHNKTLLISLQTFKLVIQRTDVPLFFLFQPVAKYRFGLKQLTPYLV